MTVTPLNVPFFSNLLLVPLKLERPALICSISTDSFLAAAMAARELYTLWSPGTPRVIVSAFSPLIRSE